jgi:hypothetical protein
VGDAAQALAAAARESYVSGFQVALVIAGIVLAVLAVIVALALRGDTATERLPGGALHE